MSSLWLSSVRRAGRRLIPGLLSSSDIKELMREQCSNNLIVTSAHRDIFRHNSQDALRKFRGCRNAFEFALV